MTIPCNLHTHTTFSDGRDSAEAVVLSAIEKGFVSIGFSDHSPLFCDEASIHADRLRGYREEILRLKEAYAGRIEIAFGLEHDAMSDTPEGYDYTLESVHFVQKDGELLPVDGHPHEKVERLYAGDWMTYLVDYYAQLNEAYARTDARIAAHIDLPMKYNDDGKLFDCTCDRYLRAARKCLETAREKEMFLEINTGAMSRGYRAAPYPHPTLLEMWKKMDGKILIGADSHSAAWIDFAFDNAVEAARRAGFRETMIWRDGGFVPFSLD